MFDIQQHFPNTFFDFVNFFDFDAKNVSHWIQIPENDDTVQQVVELPGVAREDLDVNVDQYAGVIHLCAKRRCPLRGEYEYKYSISLPSKLWDPETLTAQLTNGILLLKLKRAKNKSLIKVTVTE